MKGAADRTLSAGTEGFCAEAVSQLQQGAKTLGGAHKIQVAKAVSDASAAIAAAAHPAATATATATAASGRLFSSGSRCSALSVSAANGSPGDASMGPSSKG